MHFWSRIVNNLHVCIPLQKKKKRDTLNNICTYLGGIILIFLMHKLLLNSAIYLHCLDCAKLLRFSIYSIAKDRRKHILISKPSIYCHHKKEEIVDL
jgi:hypothetical protein